MKVVFSDKLRRCCKTSAMPARNCASSFGHRIGQPAQSGQDVLHDAQRQGRQPGAGSSSPPLSERL